MTQKIINTGTADKGNGDPIRTAFTKVNENFTELFNSVSAVVVAGATAPTSPGEGDLWWDSESGRMYVYYGTAWVDASPVDGAGINSTNELVNGNKTVSLASTGIITLPSSSYLESTNTNLKVGAQGTVTIRSNAASNITTKAWTFGTEGKLTLPAGTTYEYLSAPLTGHGDGLARLDFTLMTDGVNTNWLAASADPAGSGYSVGDTFTFDEDFLGIPGASVTIEIMSIGPGGSVEDLAFSLPPLYPADIYRDSPINLQVGAESNRWTFGHTGTLTTPGDIQLGADGYLRFSDSSFQGTAFVGDATRLYGNVNEDVEVTVRHRPTVSAECAARGSGDNFVADTSDNDDITVVQEGWTVDIGGTVYTVTAIIDGIDEFDIYATGATFVVGTTYTFTNPTATLKTWTFNDTGELTTPGEGTISHQNNDFKLEVSGSDAIVLRTFGGDTVVTSDGDLQLGGNIITQGIVELTNIGTVTAYTPGVDTFITLRGSINNGVALRATDAELATKDWLFSVDGSLTLPGGITYANGASFNGVGLETALLEINVDDGARSAVYSFNPDGTFATSGPVVFPNTSEIRPSSTAYDTALAGWEAIRGGEIQAAVDAETVTAEGWPMVNWHPTNLTAQEYIDFLDTAWAEQQQPDPVFLITPPISNGFYQTMKSALIVVRDANLGNGVSIAAGYSNAWNFGDDGALTLPNTAVIRTDGNNVEVGGMTNFNVEATGVVNIYTNDGAHQWQFGDDGNLTLPNSSTIRPSSNGALDVRGYMEPEDPGEGDLLSGGLYISGNQVSVSYVEQGVMGSQSRHQWDFHSDSGELQLAAGGIRYGDDTIQTTAYVPADNVTKVTDEWAVTTGTNTYSFTVPGDGTYVMWVKGNIPNGIITWNATASVSNTNVPAIGTQYAWNYTGGGSPIALTSIPDQIVGVAGTISTDSTYLGTTSNRFDFGISNTSGSTQTIYYGYVKIS